MKRAPLLCPSCGSPVSIRAIARALGSAGGSAGRGASKARPDTARKAIMARWQREVGKPREIGMAQAKRLVKAGKAKWAADAEIDGQTFRILERLDYMRRDRVKA